MRAILINPWTQTISETDYSGTYTDLYRLLSGPTAPGLDDARVEVFDITGTQAIPDHDLMVDDLGLVNGEPQAYFEIDGRTFAGRGVILCHGEEGNSAPATTTIEQVRSAGAFLPIGCEVHVTPVQVFGFDTTEEMLRFLSERQTPASGAND